MLIKTSKRILTVMLLLFALCLAIGLFFVPDKITFIKGLSFGTIFSVLKWLLLERAIKKTLDMPPGKAEKYARFHYFLRYALTGLMLALAAIEPTINLYAAIIGLFLPAPAAYIVKAIYKEDI